MPYGVEVGVRPGVTVTEKRTSQFCAAAEDGVAVSELFNDGIGYLARMRGEPIDVAELDAAWNSSWSSSLPVATLLQSRFVEREVRFHALPDAKRYATSDGERAEILRRHHVLLEALLSELPRVPSTGSGWYAGHSSLPGLRHNSKLMCPAFRGVGMLGFRLRP
jgi:hypothetical protein